MNSSTVQQTVQLSDEQFKRPTNSSNVSIAPQSLDHHIRHLQFRLDVLHAYMVVNKLSMLPDAGGAHAVATQLILNTCMLRMLDPAGARADSKPELQNSNSDLEFERDSNVVLDAEPADLGATLSMRYPMKRRLWLVDSLAKLKLGFLQVGRLHIVAPQLYVALLLSRLVCAGGCGWLTA